MRQGGCHHCHSTSLLTSQLTEWEGSSTHGLGGRDRAPVGSHGGFPLIATIVAEADTDTHAGSDAGDRLLWSDARSRAVRGSAMSLLCQPGLAGFRAPAWS